MSTPRSELSMTPISLVDHEQNRTRNTRDMNFNFKSLNANNSQDASLNQSHDTGVTGDKLNQSVDSTNDKGMKIAIRGTAASETITDDERSDGTSPAYTEQWDEYSSPRKSIMPSQLTHRSRESGRISPSLDPTNIDVGHQPAEQQRFNEPLKLRKGRHFVDFQPPSPTIVYVPHRSFAHGRWTNVTVQRKNGRYVVIEQRPIHTQFTDSTPMGRREYKKDVFGPETSWTKKKSPWSWSTKGNFIERSINQGFHEPYLPPMKPRYSYVGSRVGSLDNAEYQPGGGTHKVPSFKLKWEAEAKIGSLPATSRTEKSPELKLPSITPRFGASADSESFTTIHYTPGGNVVLRKQRYSDARSQVGSLDNLSHSPGGGSVEIPKNKIKWNQKAKIGSLDNVTHLPKSSNVQIFSEKPKWQTEPKVNTLENADYVPKKGKFRVPNFNKDWNKSAAPKIGSLSNANHTPGGGNVQIIDVPKKWKGKSKVDTKWKFNYDYKSLFGDEDAMIDRRTISNTSSYPYTV
ncbi:uncharacterized protein LOC127859333 [Dreissena polymorpha]|uniref:Microtubule-associated protein n=1 Tax=Dreissena polymorpha TaxID=45954 RepID=A0A9D3YLW7_DREPO|nr:uncharacterized protein LOC127859333 [Dreissena polymorpha]KAH3703214.1 hypothetical protein DPMN_078245 [Dreissena polymorpha]